MINTIIFDCIGIQSYGGGASPYSERLSDERIKTLKSVDELLRIL